VDEGLIGKTFFIIITSIFVEGVRKYDANGIGPNPGQKKEATHAPPFLPVDYGTS
jgi:hypothetical protein